MRRAATLALHLMPSLALGCAAPEPPSAAEDTCPKVAVDALTAMQDVRVEGDRATTTNGVFGAGTLLIPSHSGAADGPVPAPADWSYYALHFRFALSPARVAAGAIHENINVRGISIVYWDAARNDLPYASGHGGAFLGLALDPSRTNAEPDDQPVLGYAIELDLLQDLDAPATAEPPYAHAALTEDGDLGHPLAVSDWTSFPLAAGSGRISVYVEEGAVSVYLQPAAPDDAPPIALLETEPLLQPSAAGWLGLVPSFVSGPQSVELWDVQRCADPDARTGDAP